MFLTISEPAPSEQILRAAKKCQDWRTYFSYYLSMTSNTISAEGQDESQSLALQLSSSSIQIKAKEVVEEMVSSVTAAQLSKKREVLSDAARIMLDYCNDSAEAVDILLQAELWSEGRRIAMLCGDDTLVQKCVEAAIVQARKNIENIPERTLTFLSNMERYIQVLKIRKEGDAGSLFSAASQASHLTGASNTSSSSTSTSAS